jgi:hypothetical protein
MKPTDTKLSEQEIALSDAARDGDLKTVQKLLAAGVKADVKDDRFSLLNVTPLMRAARRGHLEVVRALLATGANVNARDKHISSTEAGGHTPLHYAAKQRHLEVAKELLKAGADINAVGTRYLGTPLCEAMIGDSEIQPSPKELLKGVKQKPVSDEERKAILAFAEFLLAQGADPNIEAKENKSVPLDGAMLRGLTETVEALLDGGANPNHQDVIGSTAFSSALLKGHVEAALLLLKRGLKIDLEDRDGWTHLFYAVGLNQPKAVIALLEAGANVNHKDKNKKTPMDWAIEQKRMEIREILKNAGGTANLKK